MLDTAYARARYALGNWGRRLSSPWRQRAVDPGIATTIFGCSFGDDGWHHLRRTLQEVDQDAAISIEHTALWRFLTRFTPQSVSDLAGVRDEEPLPLFVYPWGTFSDGSGQTAKDPRSSRFCGPSTPEFVRAEFERTVSLYGQLRRTDYRPMVYPHSFMSGTWLVAADGARRFVVMQGNHRMAVLAHLGARSVAVRTTEQAIQEVREDALPTWPLVVSGRCSADHARRVFRMFFDQNGWHVASLLS